MRLDVHTKKLLSNKITRHLYSGMHNLVARTLNHLNRSGNYVYHLPP
jgi:hypothetical protein